MQPLRDWYKDFCLFSLAQFCESVGLKYKLDARQADAFVEYYSVHGKYEIFLRTLIQSHAHKSVEIGLEQRLSADFRWSAESLAFYGLKLISNCDNRLNPLRSQNKKVYEK